MCNKEKDSRDFLRATKEKYFTLRCLQFLILLFLTKGESSLLYFFLLCSGNILMSSIQ